VQRIAEERRQAARSIGAKLLVTASPFDQRNLMGGSPPMADLGVLLGQGIDGRPGSRRGMSSAGR